MVGKNKLSGNEDVDYDSVHDLYLIGKEVQTDGLAYPISACLKINNRCNYKCAGCLPDSAAARCLDFELNDVIDALAEFAPMRLVWGGGEPTLSPHLKEYMELSMGKGFFNVVNTNMCLGDPLTDLAGEFFYQVTVHGTDREAFKKQTGWDLFDVFERHFNQLFEHGHAVTARIMLHAGWRGYLEQHVQWIKAFPIRKLLISNWMDRCQPLYGFTLDSKNDLMEIKNLIEQTSPNFPVVFPPSDIQKHSGHIVIEPAVDLSFFGKINGEIVEDKHAFIRALKSKGLDNLKLYMRQELIDPD